MSSTLEITEPDEFAIATVRTVAIDAVQAANSGGFEDPSRQRVDRGVPQELIDTGNLSGVTTSHDESRSTVRKDSR